MKKYMKYSTEIYNIYLKYFSADDIFVYSIDEVFIDVTHYLNTYNVKANILATNVIHEVYETTGITATCGIETNLYLAKVAMDVVAKHIMPNEKGVRIAWLNEEKYKRILWEHRPITDFWRVGKGIAKKLEQNNIFTMGDVAKCSLIDEEKLYKLFGVNSNRFKSSIKVFTANSLLLSSAAQAFNVYGACASNCAKLFSLANFKNLSISF